MPPGTFSGSGGMCSAEMAFDTPASSGKLTRWNGTFDWIENPRTAMLHMAIGNEPVLGHSSVSFLFKHN